MDDGILAGPPTRYVTPIGSLGLLRYRSAYRRLSCRHLVSRTPAPISPRVGPRAIKSGRFYRRRVNKRL